MSFFQKVYNFKIKKYKKNRKSVGSAKATFRKKNFTIHAYEIKQQHRNKIFKTYSVTWVWNLNHEWKKRIRSIRDVVLKVHVENQLGRLGNGRETFVDWFHSSETMESDRTRT